LMNLRKVPAPAFEVQDDGIDALGPMPQICPAAPATHRRSPVPRRSSRLCPRSQLKPSEPLRLCMAPLTAAVGTSRRAGNCEDCGEKVTSGELALLRANSWGRASGIRGGWAGGANPSGWLTFSLHRISCMKSPT
jgi:hypothetical protein